ncbi:MAG TPA: starvation-sensing protein RspA [Candidatus Avisuccinivibrio pullicola]|nr:starvation-sensing protein RspA [Candidatus Avisuccinivibrio pullicola]
MTRKVTIRDIEVINTAPEGINLTVVKVLTSEDGLYGLGCATFAYRHEAVTTYILKYLKPLMIGRDVSAIEENWALMHQNAYWRNGGVENNAISGIDLALWDIKGKMADMPVYDLLGGAVRKAVPVYRHVDGASVEEIVDQVQYYQSLGVRHLRVQSGGYGGGLDMRAPASAPRGALDGIYLNSREYIRKTVALFDKLRERLGFEMDFVHDVHERITPAEALTLGKALEPYQLFFLEDALPLDQTAWFQHFRNQCAIPLAEGELFNNPAEWRQLIVNHLIDFIRVHLTQVGGLTPARKIAILAGEFGVRTAWHGPGDMSPVAHAANIHLDLASPNFGVQEWSGIEPPNFVIQKLNEKKGALLEVFDGLPEFKDGYVYPNDRPGLGVTINEKEAAKYPCSADVTTWTQTRGRDGALVLP